MPLENASTISQLDSTWPLGLDSSSRGDDHLRLIKSVLKNQFPGLSGMGFSKPITATEDEINALPESVRKMGDTLFPVGSVVFRMDANNPSTIYGGTWALISGDATIAFGNGAAQTGVASGNNTPAVPVPAHTHTATHSLTAASSGSHIHTITGVAGPGGDGNSVGQGSSRIQYDNKSTQSAGAHTHTITGTITVASAGDAAATLDVRGSRISINVWQRTA